MLHFPNKAQKQVNTPSTVAKTGQILTQLATQVQSAPTAFSSKVHVL
jgi:hypothetical protein